jgi:tetratricopeptide (TPR) repeat protein
MRWVLAFLLVVAPGLCSGASPIPAAKMKWMQGVMDDIYRMRYEEAAEASRQRIAAAPDDPAGYVLLARTYWAQEMIRKHAFSISRFASPDFFVEDQEEKYKIKVDPAVEKRFLDTTREAIGRANAVLRKDSKNPEAMFLLGLAYQNEVSFHASTKGGWWAAFRAGQKTHRYHRRVYRAFPDFDDPLLAMGVYEYVADSVPWSLKLLTILVGAGGSKKTGREMLERAARGAQLVADDARTVLALIYVREKNYQASFEKLTVLGDKYPENYLFQVDRATLARRLGRPELAADILSTLLRTVWDKPETQPVLERAQIYTQLGLAFRDMGDLRAAENWFQIALKEPKLSSWTREGAQAELERTLEMQSQPTGSTPVRVPTATAR